MNKAVAIILVGLALISAGYLVVANTPEPMIPGVHWSYKPVLDFKVMGRGTLTSRKAGVVVNVFETANYDGKDNLEAVVADWKARQNEMNIVSEEVGTHQGMRMLLLKNSVPEKGLIEWNYFIEAPTMTVNVSIIGREKYFKPAEKQIMKLLSTLTWHEELSMSVLPYKIQLPEGWKLAKMDLMSDYFSATGQYPQVEEPYFQVRYMKFFTPASGPQERLDNDFLGDPTEEGWEVKELWDQKVGRYPARFWYLAKYDENQGKEVYKMTFRIVTNQYMYQVEAAENDQMQKELFWKVVKSWKMK